MRLEFKQTIIKPKEAICNGIYGPFKCSEYQAGFLNEFNDEFDHINNSNLTFGDIGVISISTFICIWVFITVLASLRIIDLGN